MKQLICCWLLLTVFACKNEKKMPENSDISATSSNTESVQDTTASTLQTETIAPPPKPIENTPPKGTITGSNVTMRKEASVQSDKTGSFEMGETVEILETKNVENDREAILTKPVTVKGSGGEVTLPKGKAVVIEAYQSERNYYAVSYQDPQKGKMTADIDASAVETITYSTWYRVKKSGGEIGWVIGKFLKTNG
ncbi:MAG: hypothetical protein SFV22_12820 [Saprospiraceae bacterium]|nr:hypothetical protein [Saprospiraceae bacterium]